MIDYRDRERRIRIENLERRTREIEAEMRRFPTWSDVWWRKLRRLDETVTKLLGTVKGD